ncbi:SH3 domain-containing protein [Lewinella sp. W8]|uniref:SH3 domain-containing protein n=1 Tax=Lewinella sp. W8 TaxID=2528208 RepID=UPI001067D9F5|nr:SH3 domain-containing protein [Lewinella sp. W8]MTB52114.1 hypothetical protein [Lewinella sp. W8]
MIRLSRFLFLFALAALLMACGGEAAAPATDAPAEEREKPTIIMPKPKGLEAGETLYAWVDRLNIRESPELKAKVVANISSKNPLLFTGKQSDHTETVLLRGVVYEAPWLEVKTEDATPGWVFGGAVKMVGEEKGNPEQDPEYVQYPYFGTFDLSEWNKVSGGEESGGDATTETTVYERGGQTLTITFTDVGEYGYSYSYVLAEGEETLRTRLLDFSTDDGLLLMEQVVNYQEDPAVEYRRTQILKKHPMLLGGKPIMVNGPWNQGPVQGE